MWGQPWLWTCDAHNLRAINTEPLAKCFGVEALRKPANTGWMGDGIFISDGERWVQSRALFKPLFARANIADLEPLADHIRRLFNLIPDDGVTFDLQPLFRRLYLDISFGYLFGQTPGATLREPGAASLDCERFHKAFELATVGMGKRHNLGRAYFLADADRPYREACAFVHQVFDGYIDTAISIQQQQNQRTKMPTPSSTDNQPFNMLSELVRGIHDRQFLRDQLLNVFLGAKDTATIGISDIFFHLARHPRVWRKLRENVLQCAHEPITYELLKSMKYLQNVIRESLRLLSPVDRSIRECNEDCILPQGGGQNGDQPILVSRGTRIEGRIGVLHRDVALWGSDAEAFIPERWEDENLRPYWDYIPFLGGGRMCPAQQLTLVQYSYILVRFAQNYETIENRDSEEEFVEEIKFGKQSKNGVQVALRRAKI